MDMDVDISGLAAKPFTRWTGETEQAFLMALRMSGQVRKAAEQIGRSLGAAYKRRERDPEFAKAWDATVAAHQSAWLAQQRAALGESGGGDVDDAGGGRLEPGRERVDGWNAKRRQLFLKTLTASKDVRAACVAVGLSDTAAYALKGRSPPFARAWAKALADDAPSVIDAAIARAMEGWDEPIFHGGKIVGTRKRYSDGLMRDLLKREVAREQAGEARDGGETGGGAKDEDAIVLDAAAAVARLKGRPDPRGVLRNAAERYAWDVAAAAGGVWTEVPRPEATDAAILDKIEKLDLIRARETAQRHEAEWARWRSGWGAGARMAVAPGPKHGSDAEGAPETLVPG